jgi:hypothetical protein
MPSSISFTASGIGALEPGAEVALGLLVPFLHGALGGTLGGEFEALLLRLVEFTETHDVVDDDAHEAHAIVALGFGEFEDVLRDLGVEGSLFLLGTGSGRVLGGSLFLRVGRVAVLFTDDAEGIGFVDPVLGRERCRREAGQQDEGEDAHEKIQFDSS